MFVSLSTPWLLLLCLAAIVIILLAGTRMTVLADRLADRTGIGEAVAGGVLLGAATSASGAVVSLTAALDGRASLAFSNGIGGIAAQTCFLALADLFHRRANLEHAAAELANVFQCVLLLTMLSIPLVALTAPETTLLGVHPASWVLILCYLIGVRATARVRSAPMWKPVATEQTRSDSPDEGDEPGTQVRPLAIRFVLLVILMALVGWTLANIASTLIDRHELSASVVGALLTAVLTSLPELVTTLAAVRRGALQLAVGGIIGGNTFDVLFLTISDAGYRDGSLYHAATLDDYFWLSIASLMTAVLLLGLIYRERRGPGGIGVESVALLFIYGGAIALQFA